MAKPITAKQLILITGATRGLGHAMTDGFAGLGHTVLGCGRSKEGVEALRHAHGKPHDFDVVNVADDAQVQTWARRLLVEYGPPDLILNNAALINVNAPLWKVPAAAFSDVVDVNIKGVANVIRHFVPAMVNVKRGVIVNFSSGWGRSVSPEVAPYCATKFAIEGLTRALAEEIPEGMAAIPLSPGVIDTDMLRSCMGAGAASYSAPAEWAKRAIPFILKLGAKDNGKSLSIS